MLTLKAQGQVETRSATTRMRDVIPWAVSLAPIAAVAVDPLLGRAAPWVILAGSSAACLWDRARHAGMRDPRYPVWSALIFPVHLVRRSREVDQRVPFALLWIVAMLLHSMF